MQYGMQKTGSNIAANVWCLQNQAVRKAFFLEIDLYNLNFTTKTSFWFDYKPTNSSLEQTKENQYLFHLLL